jgi:hypothetical protein
MICEIRPDKPKEEKEIKETKTQRRKKAGFKVKELESRRKRVLTQKRRY